MSLRTRIVSGREELRAIEAGWDALCVRVSCSPFTSAALYMSWLDELGEGKEPFVVVVEREGEIVAVAPWVSRGPMVYSLPGRVLVAGELVVAPEDGVAAWGEILRAVRAQRKVKFLLVPHLRPGPIGSEGAEAACRELGLSYNLSPRFGRYWLRLDGTTFDEYIASWSRLGRRNLRWSHRDLDRVGATFTRMTVAEGYSIVRELHVQQWSADVSHSWIHTEPGMRIDLDLCAKLPSGVLVLDVEGQHVAAVMWVDSGRLRTHYYSGRNMEFSVGSPGEVIFVELVKRSFEDGIGVIDDMGEGTAKEHLRLEREEGYELLVAMRGLTGAALMGIRRLQLRARGLR